METRDALRPADHPRPQAMRDHAARPEHLGQNDCGGCRQPLLLTICGYDRRLGVLHLACLEHLKSLTGGRAGEERR